jgi:hypothetical protein
MLLESLGDFFTQPQWTDVRGRVRLLRKAAELLKRKNRNNNKITLFCIANSESQNSRCRIKGRMAERTFWEGKMLQSPLTKRV